MSIEEKAKAYDEAIAKLKRYEGSPTLWSYSDICEKFFPELKEREDERIRKEITTYLKSVIANKGYGDKIIESWIAWLEKQGEQKPANKVEPKFKIEKGKYYICIRNLDDNYGTRAFCKGSTYYSTKDETLLPDNSNVPFEIKYCVNDYFRLWIIQDAKDGDVLFTSSTASHETFIFKSIDEKGNAECYFAYDSEDGFREGKYHFIGSAINCKPATKEQRDLLFQKMREKGYEWNVKKKELKKIKQKPTDRVKLKFKTN